MKNDLIPPRLNVIFSFFSYRTNITDIFQVSSGIFTNVAREVQPAKVTSRDVIAFVYVNNSSARRSRQISEAQPCNTDFVPNVAVPAIMEPSTTLLGLKGGSSAESPALPSASCH
jgi:hypothetical protein